MSPSIITRMRHRIHSVLTNEIVEKVEVRKSGIDPCYPLTAGVRQE